MEKDNYSLDVDKPEEVAKILYHAAESYNESVSELSAAWQDKEAGKIWGKIAKILEKAAGQIETLFHKEV